MNLNNWTSLAVNGIIAIVFGIMALFLPDTTILVIIKYFGLMILVAGVIILISAFTKRKSDAPYTLPILQGVASIVFGGLIMFYTQESLSIFVIILGVWAIIIGLVQLLLASRLKSEGNTKNMLVVNGLLTLVFGVVMFFNPFQSAVAFIFITGVLALVIGVFLLYFAYKVKTSEE